MLLWVLKCACGAPARSMVKDDGRDGVLEVEQQRADVYLEGNVFCGGGFCLNDPTLAPEKKVGRLAKTYEELIKFPYGAHQLMEFAADCKTWVSAEVQELLALARLDWATSKRIADEIRREAHTTDDLFAPLYVVDAENLLARLARDRVALARADGPFRARGRARRSARPGTFTLRRPAVLPAPRIRSAGDLADLQHQERVARRGRAKKRSAPGEAKPKRTVKRKSGVKRGVKRGVKPAKRPRGCKNLFFSDLGGVRAHKDTETGELFLLDKLA